MDCYFPLLVPDAFLDARKDFHRENRVVSKLKIDVGAILAIRKQLRQQEVGVRYVSRGYIATQRAMKVRALRVLDEIRHEKFQNLRAPATEIRAEVLFDVDEKLFVRLRAVVQYQMEIRFFDLFHQIAADTHEAPLAGLVRHFAQRLVAVSCIPFAFYPLERVDVLLRCLKTQQNLLFAVKRKIRSTQLLKRFLY